MVQRTSGLLDGDIVEFSVEGGTPKAYVWAELCVPESVAGACDADTARQFPVLPDGTLTLSPKKLDTQLATGLACSTVAPPSWRTRASWPWRMTPAPPSSAGHHRPGTAGRGD
ncbi:hypothetical protein [Streptomyces lavendulae]|uniref:hypothetical protein n=1 Tax=Streptomyces lavendulae TaxID=1914 RepID=UPI0031F02920